MKWLKALYKESESFRNFTANTGLAVSDMAELNKDLKKAGELEDITLNFLEVLCENRRLNCLPAVCDKYAKLYSIMNREEKITIISAHELGEDERGEVKEALKKGQKGTQFTLEFKEDPTI